MKIFNLRKTTPRWIIFIIDLIIIAIALHISYFIRFNFSIPLNEWTLYLKYVFPIIIICRTILMLLFKTYEGLIRYTGIEDAKRIIISLFSGSILFVLINLFTYYYYKLFIIPFSIIILEFLTSTFLLIFLRLFVKLSFFETVNKNQFNSNAAIVGINELALAVKRSIENNISVKFRTKAFIDPYNKSKHIRIEGIRVYKLNQLDYLKNKIKLTHLIIADEQLSKQIQNEISDWAINNGIKVFIVPPINKWLNGQLSLQQLKQIRIEDLLERDEIHLDIQNIKSQLEGKVVMITGAAGSIGSEIVRQIIRFNPSLIILYDQAETPLYNLCLELEEKYHFKQYKYIIGDITNSHRLEYIIKRYKPLIIYHAAAYKHVPVMETNPYEAISTNVLGTKILADLAVKYQIDRFVMISTDKAVNPTNVMGASKRIAEMYCQALGKQSKTKFITTRFGNVLGSNGSVIPRFKQQIEEGGPITVTHPDVTRYFMTIPEACQLVLEAGAMGKENEIFIFDMGKPIKIVDLARKMIKLAGLEEGKDINIIFTGLRPGEKIYEELLNKNENTLPTYHPLIMIAKVDDVDFNKITQQINSLIENLSTFDNYNIVKKMKEIVPEFISFNSSYEILDKEKLHSPNL